MSTYQRRAGSVSSAAIGAMLAAPCLGQATLTGLGPPASGAGASTFVTGISADGGAVIGYELLNSDLRGFRWTAAAGRALLGPGIWSSCPTAASADGSVIVGTDENALLSFRWTAATGIQLLATPSAGTCPGAWAAGVTGDGSVPVGSYTPDCEGLVWQPCRWIAGAITNLPIPAGSVAARARGASADGSVIAGACWDASRTHIARWSGGAAQDLGTVPGTTSSEAYGISADGTAIIGEGGSRTTGAGRAFRWTAADGVRNLGLLPGTTFSYALAVSGDGSVVVGVSDSTGYDPHAFIWTPARGMVDLRSLLQSLGANVTGWRLNVAAGVSADGRTITGYGDFQLSQLTGWLAHLPASAVCYPNCDGSSAAPVLNVNDFICFLNKFAAGDPFANCDQSTAPPILNVQDFTCFLNRFATGCH